MVVFLLAAFMLAALASEVPVRLRYLFLPFFFLFLFFFFFFLSPSLTAFLGQPRQNCAQLCDLQHNDEAPPAEWCVCQSGKVSSGSQQLFVYLDDKEDYDRSRQGRAPRQNSPSADLNVTGSVIFNAPVTNCVDTGDWGSFPRRFLSPYPGFFSVRDQGICGDWFLVYDNGVLLGPTSKPNCSSLAECYDFIWNASLGPDPCLSRGCYFLAPNVEHNITVTVGFTYFPGQDLGADVAYYAEAPGADCSQSQLTGPNLSLNYCTPTPPITGNNPCPPGGVLPAAQGCPTYLVE